MTASAAPIARRPVADPARLATLCHALSDPTRVAVVDLLRFGERCVCDLQDDLDIAQSRLSFHLKVLRDAGLVVDRRDGRWAFYSLTPAAIEELHDLIARLRPRKGQLPVVRERCCD